MRAARLRRRAGDGPARAIAPAQRAAAVEGALPPGHALEIETIDAVAPGRELTFHLDAPASGQRSGAFAVELRGWIAATMRPEALELEAGDAGSRELGLQPAGQGEAARTPSGVERRRFAASLSTLELPERFALRILASFEDGERRRLCEIQGRQEPLLDGAGELRPVLVTGLGRSGSTWLVHLLGRHPLITSYRPFRQEPRLVAWWIEALLALCSPASQGAMLAPQGFGDDWWLGDSSRPPRPWQDEQIRGLLLGDGPRSVAALARERIDAFYSVSAELEGGRPAAFVEKGPGSLDRGTWNLAAKLFPGIHEVLLLRDPRDVACSTMAYRERNPGAVLGPRGAGLEQLVGWAATEMAARLRKARERGDAASVVRYEQLVADPKAALTPPLEKLGLDASAATIAAMTEAAEDLAAEATPRHSTSTTPADSVGRWRRELPEDGLPEVAPLLEELGY